MNITVIGTGYVGLVTGACFSNMGNKVYCVDVIKEKIEGLKNNILPIYEPHLETIVKDNQKRGDLIFTTNLKEALDNTNIIFIAVGTPMSKDGSANLDYIFQAAENIADNIKHDSLIVIKSTVPVGTGFKVKELIESRLRKNKSNVKIDIASNPEFLKEGTAVEDCLHPDRVVLGAEKPE
ncbi:MAG: nucleotide sugar dehydrogenase, partial [Methanobrevibacter wolinii]